MHPTLPAAKTCAAPELPYSLLFVAQVDRLGRDAKENRSSKLTSSNATTTAPPQQQVRPTSSQISKRSLIQVAASCSTVFAVTIGLQFTSSALVLRRMVITTSVGGLARTLQGAVQLQSCRSPPLASSPSALVQGKASGIQDIVESMPACACAAGQDSVHSIPAALTKDMHIAAGPLTACMVVVSHSTLAVAGWCLCT